MEHINCPFCNEKDEEVVLKNDLCFARFDRYPVNKGHLLIITFRHFDNYFNATHKEKISLIDLIEKSKDFLLQNFNPDGFNIGINCGEPAGQTIMHFHCHIIPRYRGDIENPRGGVRGVIPSKMNYK
jgi:diadenosine tetraphosphate (Ap4A) HIT family hydrolase|tara:strand:+ start:1986 stop:2366 length:381 start_codon:yes stop_codon:yes gene_type:complete